MAGETAADVAGDLGCEGKGGWLAETGVSQGAMHFFCHKGNFGFGTKPGSKQRGSMAKETLGLDPSPKSVLAAEGGQRGGSRQKRFMAKKVLDSDLNPNPFFWRLRVGRGGVHDTEGRFMAKKTLRQGGRPPWPAHGKKDFGFGSESKIFFVG